jgi:DNA-binding Xre family transcriptional regulator
MTANPLTAWIQAKRDDAICEALGRQPGDIIRHVENDDEESDP